MSLIINLNPPSLSAVYSPFNIYRVVSLQGGIPYTATRFVSLEVEVFINGVVQTPVKYITPYIVNRDSIPGTLICAYEFSISDLLQRFFDQDELFPDPGTGGSLSGGNYQAEVYIRLWEWVPDPNDNYILKRSATSLDSTTFHAFNARFYFDESQVLDPYVYFLGSQIQPLTKKPETSVVSLDDSEWLPYIGNAVSHIRVTSFNTDGTQVAQGEFPSNTQAFDSNEMILSGVGPANINAVPTGDWTGTQVIIDSTIGFYQVELGTYLAGSVWFSLTQLRTYFLRSSACREERIHFINSLGGIDSVSVWDYAKLTMKTSDQIHQLPRERGGVVSSRRLSRTMVRGEKTLEVVMTKLTQQEQIWLVRELSMSPNVFLERSGVLVPYRILPGSFVESDSNDPVPTLTFRLTPSNIDKSQRN